MRTGATNVAPAPMVAPSSTSVASQRGALGKAARGLRMFVKTALEPTKTFFPSVTPAQMLVWLCTREPAPMTAPGATKQNAPMTQSLPSDASSATTAVG